MRGRQQEIVCAEGVSFSLFQNYAWGLAGGRFVGSRDFCGCPRWGERGHDDKGRHTFVDINCNFRCHANFLSGSGLLFQQYYIPATLSGRVLSAAVRFFIADIFDRKPRAAGGA